MKTLLTLFVLLFASSVVAEDDLNGLSIVCGALFEQLCKEPELPLDEYECASPEDRESESEYLIFGIEFEDKHKLSFYDTTGVFFAMSPDNPKVPLFYKADLDSILMNYEDDFKDPTLTIDRRSLNLSIKDKVFFKGNYCIVYKENENIENKLIKMKNKLIAEKTKDNKI